MPSELQGVLSQDKWDSRLSKIQELCARYGKPMFERIFFVVATLYVYAIVLPPLTVVSSLLYRGPGAANLHNHPLSYISIISFHTLIVHLIYV